MGHPELIKIVIIEKCPKLLILRIYGSLLLQLLGLLSPSTFDCCQTMYSFIPCTVAVFPVFHSIAVVLWAGVSLPGTWRKHVA